MARIPREEHATIRARVEAGQEKVAAVAASYNCTPANIYAILAKLRREGTPDGAQQADPPALAKPSEPPSATSPAAVAVATPELPPSDDGLPLFGMPPLPAEAPLATSFQDASQAIAANAAPEATVSLDLPNTLSEAASAEPTTPPLPPVRADQPGLQAPSKAPAKPPRSPAQPASRPAVSKPEPKAASSGSKSARTGIALLMRTTDGEEAVHPFRSLEELLSAAKPILRTAAKSPDPIWFSIQTVDLDTLEDAF